MELRPTLWNGQVVVKEAVVVISDDLKGFCFSIIPINTPTPDKNNQVNLSSRL